MSVPAGGAEIRLLIAVASFQCSASALTCVPSKGQTSAPAGSSRAHWGQRTKTDYVADGSVGSGLEDRVGSRGNNVPSIPSEGIASSIRITTAAGCRILVQSANS